MLDMNVFNRTVVTSYKKYKSSLFCYGGTKWTLNKILIRTSLQGVLLSWLLTQACRNRKYLPNTNISKGFLIVNWSDHDHFRWYYLWEINSWLGPVMPTPVSLDKWSCVEVVTLFVYFSANFLTVASYIFCLYCM